MPGLVTTKLDGGKLRKVISFEIKDASENAEERSFDAVASTEAIDRDNDIIRAKGWKLANYRKNPVLQFAHNYSTPPIGKGASAKVDGETLVFRPTFPPEGKNQLSDLVYEMGKFIGAMAFSVGFNPIEFGKRPDLTDEEWYSMWGGYEYTKQELLEISAVPVPANQDAVARVKSLGLDPHLIVLEEEKQAKDAALSGIVTIDMAGEDFDEETLEHVDIDKRLGVRAMVGRTAAGILAVKGYVFDNFVEEKAAGWVEENGETVGRYLPAVLEREKGNDPPEVGGKDTEPEPNEPGDILVVDDPAPDDADVLALEPDGEETIDIAPEQVRSMIRETLADVVSEAVKTEINYRLGVLED